MRKFLALLGLLMLISAGLAFAEETPDLYDLYDAGEAGKTWIGTAVPIRDGVAVTSPVGLPRQVNRLEIWDGGAYRTVTAALSVADGKILVLLHETDGGKPAIPAYSLLEAGTVPGSGELMVRSGDWMRSRINRAVYDAAVIEWNNREAMVLTLSGDTTVGSPLVTKDGKLAGIVTAEYAEGMNRYVALTVPEITNCLNEAAAILNGVQAADTRPEGYTVTAEGNEVTFDWSGVQLPEAKEGETLYHILADYESTYLNYSEITEGETSITYYLTPGRTYVSGIAAFSDVPHGLPEELAVTVMPPAEPMTEHQFSSAVFAIGEIQADASPEDMPTVPAEITEALLRSGRACIYSVSSYTVDGRTEDVPLLITLTTPDGDNFRHDSGWYYDASIMEKDEWYTNFDDTGLLDLLNQDGYPEGTYELTMYIDGKLADSFSFTLIK